MRSKRFSAVFSILLLLCTLLPLPCAAADAQELLDGVLSFEKAQDRADSVQEWLDSGLAQRAGVTAEWYVLALSQNGETYDFSAYRSALDRYLSENTVSSAATRQKYALVYRSIGGGEAYIAETMGNSVGELGLMSWVYGLHLVNNGCEERPHAPQEIVRTILDLQLPDGGWALSGNAADVDVTAMTLQALAPYSAEYPAEIDRALTLLSERQLADGDFASYGTPNPESTAQVMTALLALGIEPLGDPRFVKDGRTLLDGIAKYRLADGSFCHVQGGAMNENANMQVFFALSALQSGNAPYLLYVPVQNDGQVADYRVIVTVCILGAAGIACIVLFLRKKRGAKHYLPVLIAAAAGIALVWLVQIESAEKYYRSESLTDAEIIGTVTLSIRCDMVAGKAAHIPENGEILAETEIPIAGGATVFDVLTDAARANGIRMEYSGTPQLAYVQGIADLYEFDHGDLSGWVYHVNGASPSVGCGEYVLHDGDAVEWLYSLDLGKDVAE